MLIWKLTVINRFKCQNYVWGVMLWTGEWAQGLRPSRLPVTHVECDLNNLQALRHNMMFDGDVLTWNSISWDSKRLAVKYFKISVASLCNCPVHSHFTFGALLKIRCHNDDRRGRVRVRALQRPSENIVGIESWSFQSSESRQRQYASWASNLNDSLASLTQLDLLDRGCLETQTLVINHSSRLKLCHGRENRNLGQQVIVISCVMMKEKRFLCMLLHGQCLMIRISAARNYVF